MSDHEHFDGSDDEDRTTAVPRRSSFSEQEMDDDMIAKLAAASSAGIEQQREDSGQADLNDKSHSSKEAEAGQNKADEQSGKSSEAAPPSLSRDQRLAPQPGAFAMGNTAGSAVAGSAEVNDSMDVVSESNNPRESTASVPVAETLDESAFRNQILKEIAESAYEATPIVDENEDSSESPQTTESNAKSKKKYFLWIGLLVLILAVAGIVGGVVASSSSGGSTSQDQTNTEEEDSNDSADTNPTTDITSSPTLSPITAAPTTLFSRVYGIAASFSGETILNDETSFQAQALQWVREADQLLEKRTDAELETRYALATLYYATAGPTVWNNFEFLLSSNNSNSTHCEWDGVVCNQDKTKIQRLDLMDMGLLGELPPEIGLLSSLKVLDLSGSNQLKGNLPTEIGLMTGLEQLLVPGGLLKENNEPNPNQRKLIRQRYLEQDTPAVGNALTGPVPSELGYCTNLRTIELGGNALGSTIITELGQLAKLERLDLSRNLFSGTVPLQLGFLAELKVLSLSLNPKLTGQVPNSLCSSVSLIEELSADCLDRSSVQEEMVICKCCTECCNDQNMCVSNDVTPLPSMFPSMSPSQVPSSMPSLEPTQGPTRTGSRAPSRTTLSPSSMPTKQPTTMAPTTPSPTTMVPTMISTLATTGLLTRLNTMVESISRQSDLENPDSAQAQALAWMTADTLGGTLWKSDYDLMQRYVMVVFYYATEGPTWEAQHSFLSFDKPVCEWNSQSLDPMLICDSQGRVIELDANDRGLSGSLPRELGFLTLLKFLYLGQNPNMAGSIPTELGLLGNLLELDVSTSDCEGTIPTQLAQLSKLSVLALQDNFLTGTVPEALGTLSSLKEVYLQATELEGTIPEGFCQNDMWDLEADCVSARPNRQDPKIECNCCTRCYDANETPYDCYNRQGQYFCAPGDSGLPALDEDDEPPNDDEEEEGPPDGERPPPPPPDDGLPPPDDSGKPPKLR